MAKKKSADGKTVVIVESPTKARTIRKFLGKDYVVESCMGHIRDLPGSAKDIPEKFKKEKWASLGVNPDKNFSPIYCIPKKKTKIVSELKSLVKGASELYLATDEDREGESISWHLLEVLKPKVPVKRMVFHEITKDAIKEAIENPRDLDENLVRAQEARRILDRLVGYTISPLIWKKIAYGLSAGRVQSVAVRLIAEREDERMRFHKANYWNLMADLNKGKANFDARLQTYDGKRIATGKDFSAETGELLKDKKAGLLHLNEASAKKIKEELSKGSWRVESVEEKPMTRRPSAPFITSTLQQDGSRKFGWGASQTMRTAQALYEQGFITYMRTDSTNLSKQAIAAARSSIKKMYGNEYLPKEPRFYTGKKVKGAQEAHEAIRPAGSEFVTPEESGLSGEALKLYDLIWKRTMACQMADSKQKKVAVKIKNDKAIFGANGLVIEFPGFLRAYVEGRDDTEAALEERETQLPPLKAKDPLSCDKLETTQHETKPPARFTEASLIQTMEKEGIGRPSTYAPTISTIIFRGYVRKVGTALVPTFTALVVSNLLRKYFPQYVDTSFTSAMENSLDEIAEGDMDWVKYLKTVYSGKKGLKAQVEERESEIVPDEARSVQLSGLNQFAFRVGRYGAYVCRQENGEEVCASIPEVSAPADMTEELVNKLIDQKLSGGDSLGKDPDSGRSVYVLNGRYGPYVQLGEVNDEETKPKRMAIPANIEPEDITLEQALFLLSMPRPLGKHPESEKDVKVGIGRFGPYVVHDGDYRSVPKSESLFDMTFDRAMELLAQPKKGRGRSQVVKELGEHPKNKEAIAVCNGKYGPYLKWGKKNFSLPEGVKPEDMTLEKAIELLDNTDQGKESGKTKATRVKKAKKKAVKKKAKKKAGKKAAKKVAKKAKKKSESSSATTS